MKTIKRIADLEPDQHNANTPSERGAAMLSTSIVDLGAGRSVVVDADGKIIAGNKTVEAAKAAGIPIEVVQTKGEKLIVVQRTDLDLDDVHGKARRLAYADNRTSELSSWSPEQILADAEKGIDLSDFFNDRELDDIIGGLINEDEAQGNGEADASFGVKPGQLWRINEHRVFCGDSLEAADFNSLMQGDTFDMAFCDPPFELDYILPKFIFDNGAPKGCHVFLIASDKTILANLLAHREKFIRFWCLDSKFKYMTGGNSPMIGMNIISEFKVGVLGAEFNHGGSRFINRRDGFANIVEFRRLGSRSGETLYAFEKHREMYEKFIIHYTQRGDIVFDPFLGSGSILLACEATGRRLCGIEKDVNYVENLLIRCELKGMEIELNEG